MNSGRRYYFLTIAEMCNITRAAERLMVSQPSLTQYLNKLEQELGVKLLDRHFTPLRLTEAGEVYRAYLQDAYEREQALETALDAYRPQSKKTLQIGLPLQKSPDVAKRILPHFISAHPGIELSIWEGTAQTVRKRVLQGELEIGFGYTTLADEECTVEPLEQERIVIVCNANNPLAGGRASSLRQPLPVQPEALRDQLFYQMAPEYFLYEVEMQHLQQYGVKPRRKLVMSNLHGILNSIVDSPESGYALMPDYVFQESSARALASSLAFLKLGEEPLEWQFSMLRKKGRVLSAEGRAFWNCVVELHDQ